MLTPRRVLSLLWGVVLAAASLLAVAALVDGDLLGVVVGGAVAAWAYTSLRAVLRAAPRVPPVRAARPAAPTRPRRRRGRA